MYREREARTCAKWTRCLHFASASQAAAFRKTLYEPAKRQLVRLSRLTQPKILKLSSQSAVPWSLHSQSQGCCRSRTDGGGGCRVHLFVCVRVCVCVIPCENNTFSLSQTLPFANLRWLKHMEHFVHCRERRFLTSEFILASQVSELCTSTLE